MSGNKPTGRCERNTFIDIFKLEECVLLVTIVLKSSSADQPAAGPTIESLVKWTLGKVMTVIIVVIAGKWRNQLLAFIIIVAAEHPTAPIVLIEIANRKGDEK
ncbi:hypothetical protein Ddc_05875 [Ditylenchus destructor]|nr:hypothetical protein Ddc_05875 [Ditylenchus destructor]